jgi:hypothetical protein
MGGDVADQRLEGDKDSLYFGKLSENVMEAFNVKIWQKFEVFYLGAI